VSYRRHKTIVEGAGAQEFCRATCCERSFSKRRFCRLGAHVTRQLLPAGASPPGLGQRARSANGHFSPSWVGVDAYPTPPSSVAWGVSPLPR